MKSSDQRQVDRKTETSGRESRGSYADSSLDFETVFVVGCPRSGTTWVQLLLAEHPNVVTAPETQIFAYYLTHFRHQWEREHENGEGQEQGRAGLSQLLSGSEFDELCRSTAEWVLEKIASRDPDADVVVEKSPKHAMQVRWIRRLFPDAHILHVVRDPRDTVSSIMAASRSWGKGWAPRHPVDAARMWRRNVEGARRGGRRSDQYREVRYEDLKRDAVEQLERIYDAFGLDADRELCEKAVEACRLSRLKKQEKNQDRPLPGSKSPDGFFRKGETGGWQQELSSSAVRMVEQVCGETMDEYGYDRIFSSRLGTRLRVGMHDAVRRVRESLDWQLQRLLRWV